jgi:hypothetical protein
MTRDQFIIIYERFESEYSNALKKADLEYQEVIASVNSYQKIVNPVGKEVGKAISPDVEFVLKFCRTGIHKNQKYISLKKIL